VRSVVAIPPLTPPMGRGTKLSSVMSSDKQPPSGRFEGGTHFLPVRVYYEDTDFTGAVYHANFLRFMERGRSESLRAAGIDHVSLAQRPEPLAFAVRSINISFLRPARIDDALMVQTSYEQVAGARITAKQQVLRGEELLAEASVEIACISLEGKPRRLPGDIAAALRKAAGGERQA